MANRSKMLKNEKNEKYIICICKKYNKCVLLLT